MENNIGEGLIVLALAAALIAHLYFRHRAKLRRLELIHQERLVAMEKDIPLPELPMEPVPGPRGPDPEGFLLHGIVWTALSSGAMIALYLGLDPTLHAFWIAPLPIALMGLGLILTYILTRERR